MRKVLTALALVAATMAATPGVLAQEIQYYRAVSSGPGESPPNASPGSSIGSFQLDGTMLRADIPFTDLTTGTVAAHIHCCTAESLAGTAGVAIPLFGFPSGVTAGNYSQTFDLMDAAVYDPNFLSAFGGTAAGASAALLDALGDNTAYLNIHTSQYPGGEIRGFMVAAPIPEPGSWAMLGVGLLGVGMMARRRIGQQAERA